MTANATLEITSVLSANVSESATKTYSGSAANFENIFNSVSKNYNDTSSHQAEAKSASNVNSKDNSASKKVTTKDSKSDDTSTNSEVKEKNSAKDSDDAGKVTTKEDESSTNAVKTTSAQSEAVDSEASALEEKIENMVQQISKMTAAIKAGTEVNANELKNDLVDLGNMVHQLNKLTKIDAKTDGTSATTDSSTQVLTDVQNVMAELQQSILSSQNLNIFNSDAKNMLTQQLKLLSADVNKKSVSSAAETSESDLQSANLKIQTQAQVQLQNQTQDVAQQDAQTQVNMQTEAVTETPLIQASSDVVAAKVNSTDLEKQTAKDALSKTSLTQEVIDKTNAKVVKVEKTSSNSSDSSNSNLLSNQNAEEQAVKLSLQTTADTSSVQDTTSQANFTNVMDKVQTSQQPASSHVLSQTEIMSQINSKLSNLKSDESTKVTIILRPESLGKINLELVTNKEGLSAQLTAENSQVKDMLDKNIESLKESLGNQGVNVNNVTVKVAETQKQDNTFSFDSQSGQNNNQQTQDNQNTSKSQFSASLENEMEDGEEADSEGTVQVAEKSVSINSHLGQVDYKI